jgi:homoserine dehydrogenase
MYKLCILGSIAFGAPVALENIYREGIRRVAARDIVYARELGYVIKLIALGRRDDDGEIELRVHPALLPMAHPLASVNDVFNAVLFTGDAVGNVMFYGRGAGGEPTGSAVVGDLVAVARNIRSKATGRVGPGKYATAVYKNFPKVETRFCIRMQVADHSGTLAQIATVFGEQGVSLDSIVQKHSDGETAEIFWVTKRTTEAAMAASLKIFDSLDAITEVSSVLRVEGE